MSSAVIIGHSFVKRCQRYVLQSGTDLFRLRQYDDVFFHGIGGARVSTIEKELEIIPHLNAKCVIFDIGSNDVSDISRSTWDIAKAIVTMAGEVVSKYGATVIIMPQFKRIKGTGRFSKHDFNVRLEELNAHLKFLCKHAPEKNVLYHNLRNMWPIWDTLISHDGVHLTTNGMLRLCRNYRSALIKA